MAVYADLFGFDELEKAFNRVEKKYPNEADAFLMAEGQAVNKKVKSLTPVKTKKLHNSWRLKKVKLYKSGTVRVVRIQSTAPHAHLVEYGHELVRGGKTRERGRTLSTVQRAARGITSKGRVEGKYMLKTAMAEAQASYTRGAQKILDKITKELEV